MVTITINNQVVEAEEGSTILDAAKTAGIYIPTLCYHEELSPSGSCRLCTVEVITNGTSQLTSACTYPVEEGLEVRTRSEKILKARRLVTELLLAQRPHSDRIQELAKELGVEKPSFTLKEKECILCELCVRACREIVGVSAISFIAQGIDQDIDEPSVVHSLEKCIGCDSCAYICPTGAIMVEDVGDTRIITAPSGKMEFKLKKCNTCGNYWAPEKQLEYIAKLANLAPETFDNCPNCRD
ncbi:MAG: 4Fe-4S dicluster domain-containing protein [Dehalococcoidia bacterium]|nr:MAG: 4Fe-4S dicluster domain-containing protein [Dehalococcoidia bacterium]